VAPSRDLKLRDLGYRLTPQRQLVWDVVRRSKRHLSAEVICAQIQRGSPGFSLASVYRTLTLLEQLGLVRSAYLGSGPAQFELAEPEEHHHTICRSCGAIMHLEDEFLQAMRAHLKESHGFLAEKVQLAVLGRCQRCAPGARRRPARARAGAHR
jgi:Fur family ferric uptake transcriptional regulator